MLESSYISVGNDINTMATKVLRLIQKKGFISYNFETKQHDLNLNWYLWKWWNQIIIRQMKSFNDNSLSSSKFKRILEHKRLILTWTCITHFKYLTVMSLTENTVK